MQLLPHFFLYRVIDVYICITYSLKEMSIRKVIQTLILVGLMLTCFSTKAKTVGGIASTSEVYAVPLMAGNPAVDPNSPRTPAVLPLSCSFDNLTGNLHFDFLFPMGDVTITLTEVEAGIVSTDDYSTSTCSVVVPVPYQGTYEISIVLDSGTEYTGQFEYL